MGVRGDFLWRRRGEVFMKAKTGIFDEIEKEIFL